MKFSIMLHFIWVYTVCKGKIRSSDKKYNMFHKNYNLTPICTMDYLKFIASNQKEEAISIQRVN